MTTQATTLTRPAFNLNPRTAVPAGLGAICLLISPVGPAWFHSPAQPQQHIPALTFSFTGLHHLADSGMAPTNWIQQAFFSWLGWLLIAATILATATAVVLRDRRFGLAAAALSILGLLAGLFATKGVQTWFQFAHQIPNLRTGAYLLVAGFLLTCAASLMIERR